MSTEHGGEKKKKRQDQQIYQVRRSEPRLPSTRSQSENRSKVGDEKKQKREGGKKGRKAEQIENGNEVVQKQEKYADKVLVGLEQGMKRKGEKLAKENCEPTKGVDDCNNNRVEQGKEVKKAKVQKEFKSENVAKELMKENRKKNQKLKTKKVKNETIETNLTKTKLSCKEPPTNSHSKGIRYKNEKTNKEGGSERDKNEKNNEDDKEQNNNMENKCYESFSRKVELGSMQQEEEGGFITPISDQESLQEFFVVKTGEGFHPSAQNENDEDPIAAMSDEIDKFIDIMLKNIVGESEGITDEKDECGEPGVLKDEIDEYIDTLLKSIVRSLELENRERAHNPVKDRESKRVCFVTTKQDAFVVTDDVERPKTKSILRQKGEIHNKGKRISFEDISECWKPVEYAEDHDGAERADKEHGHGRDNVETQRTVAFEEHGNLNPGKGVFLCFDF